jgi:hypothetical protein
MDDSQREAMFDAWKRSTIELTSKKEIDENKATVSVEYEGVVYCETVHKNDCYGTSEPYNIAFNRLLSKMKTINKKIEIKYF